MHNDLLIEGMGSENGGYTGVIIDLTNVTNKYKRGKSWSWDIGFASAL